MHRSDGKDRALLCYRLLVEIWNDKETELRKKLLELRGIDPDEFLLNLLLIIQMLILLFLIVLASWKYRVPNCCRLQFNREANLTETDIMEKYSLVKGKMEGMADKPCCYLIYDRGKNIGN
ncbi:hypothetical protein SDJN03_07706, partial [Cucurbita argyrosperma subsp. sororia]